jgi:hypothetical protein
MLTNFSAENRAVTGAVGAIIILVLLGGIVAATTTSDSGSKSKPAATKAPSDEAARKAAEDAQRRAADIQAANATALKSILADQDQCKTKYLAQAQARADQARQDLKEQQESLQRIFDQLPPGKAKDTLGAQLPLEFETANQFVDSELRAAQDRCRLALTVYQYTQAEGQPAPGQPEGQPAPG